MTGRRTKVTWPDGNFVYSNFDNLNRVTKVCENGASGCPSGLLITYTLDPLSRRDAIARPNSTSSDFDYDLASRLTLLSQNVSGTTNDLSRTFTYTPAGQLATRVNATAAHWLAATPGSSAYVANGRNQYTAVAGATHTHDLNGNLTGDGSRTFGYDAENRLTSVSGSASLTLTYDPLGRLRQTTAGVATTDFLYEGDRLLAEYNGATVLRRYAHGPGVDEPIVWYEGANLSTKRWLHPDERGSIVAFSDGAGAATVYRYGAYGEPAGNDFSGSRFRYTGQIALPEVKLYHYKARVYDPALGRFLQTDPVGYQDDFNLYAYVYNDPFNRWDPTGLDALVILRDNNVVEITLPVIWSGNAATESNVSSAAGNIGSVWSGQKGKYSVTTTVAALAPGAEKTEPVFNTASLTEEPTDRNNGHSYVRDNSEAHITMKDVRGETIGSTRGVKGSNTTAHEAGHLLGLENKEGDSGNIMDTGTGSGVSEADIDAVINSNINTIQDCRSLAGSAPAC